MKILKTVLSAFLILAALSAVLHPEFSFAEESTIVTDSLVFRLDAEKNAGDRHDSEASVWKDLVSGVEVPVVKNDANYFTDTAYHLCGVKNLLPKTLLNVVNGEEFTVELRLGKIYATGSSFSTMINNSSNDRFSLFLRTSGDYLEFKHSASTGDRPKVGSGKELAEYSTVTVTRSVKTGQCILYVDGVPVGSGPAAAKVGADGDFFFGHDEATRRHEADYEAIRFYDRALREEEVIQNARADGNFDESTVKRNYILPSQPDTGVIGGVTLCETIDSQEKLRTLLTAKEKPACALIYLDEDLQLISSSGVPFGVFAEELLQMDPSDVIPAFYVKSPNAAGALIRGLEEARFEDYFLVSDDPALLHDMRSEHPLIRTILDDSVRLKGKTSFTDEELLQLRARTLSCYTHILLLPQSASDKKIVEKLCRMQITPWIFAETLPAPQDALQLLLSSAYGVVSGDSSFLLHTAQKYLTENTLVRAPLNVGHRGIPSKASLVPENTLESALLAYEAGANAVELDIYMTTDGVLVINHNSTTTFTSASGKTEKMVSDKTGLPASLSIESSRSLDLAHLYYPGYYVLNEDGSYRTDENGEKIVDDSFRIPTLASYLEAFKGKDVQLFIEIKSAKAKVVPALRELIEKYDMYGQCNVITFGSTGQCSKMYELYPEMNCSILTGGNPFPADERSAIRAVLAETQPVNTTYSPERTGHDAKFVRAATYRGLTVWPYTINDETEIYRSILAGYAGITGNRADLYGRLAREFSASAPDEVAAGSIFTLQTSLQTYARNVSQPQDVTVAVIAGEDLVQERNGLSFTLKDDASGQIVFLVSYTQKMNASLQYTIYAQPVCVSVRDSRTDPTPSVSSEPTPPVAVSSSDGAVESGSAAASGLSEDDRTKPTIVGFLVAGAFAILIGAFVIFIRVRTTRKMRYKSPW